MTVRFIDLFCGIGGFRFAAEAASQNVGITPSCVFSSDIDEPCQTAYAANFGDTPVGDITQVNTNDIPDHDLLLGGFPCQPFSIIGKRRGFEDTRGTLFFDIARIIEAKKPKAFILENVKLLAGHDKGRTLRRIIETLQELGYAIEYKILNALDFGLPHKRERIWLVGRRSSTGVMHWPTGSMSMKPLSQVLETKVPERYFASQRIQERRRAVLKTTHKPAIWHENKAGHVSAYPYSCALRAGASYNYLLVDGVRRLTPREMLRLQGFPEHFRIACNDSQTRKQVGNSLPVSVAEAVLTGLFTGLNWVKKETYKQAEEIPSLQYSLLEQQERYA